MAKKYFIWKDPACNGKDNRKDNGTPVQSTVRAKFGFAAGNEGGSVRTTAGVRFP